MAEQSVIQMLKSGQSDLEWFEDNLHRLRSEYNNKFIAFHNKRVLEEDSSLNNLMKKLDKKKIDKSNIFIKFVSRVKAIL